MHFQPLNNENVRKSQLERLKLICKKFAFLEEPDIFKGENYCCLRELKLLLPF